jgi:hypothetical protein
MRAGRADAVTRVPRTEAESQQLLMTRPTGWEFLHFAARLLRERAAVEGKYRDFVMGYAPPTDEVICIEDAPEFISRAVRYAMQRTRNLNRVISPAVQEGTFGRPGEDFVDTFVAQNDQLPEQIAMGKPMTPDLTVTFSIPDETVEAIRAELRRVAEVFGRRRRGTR